LRKAAALLHPLVLVAGLLLSGDVLAAALQRNLGHLPLLAGTGPCGDRPSSPPVEYLERAVRLQANSPSAWRTLLRARGWSDRQGIRDALGQSPPSWADPRALRQAADTLRPSSWAMEQPWTEERCRAAWDAWTLGLVWAMDGRWSEAVAAYQAGLGLAPGRVPGEIVQEYYLALARHNLAGGALPPERELATAKYLALGGEPAEALERFRALLSGSTLDPAREGQAECWVAWLGDGASPPGPGACTNGAADPDRAPNWVLPFENTGASALEDPNLSRSLWGFDLDADILEAGAEVLGTLYWRGPAGEVFAEDFRQANLWPNSGTS